MVQRAGTGSHVVLASADSDAFTSLRRRATSRPDRYRMGKELRRRVPRRSLGEWTVRTGRSRPVQLIVESHRGRLDWLIPVRVGRMAATPYGFLRGAAVVMADDAARLPSTGITPVICGDAHLGNFGFYASPEQDLVIDLNDFDEAHPGAWEWDLRRLVVSTWIAGRQNGASEQACEVAGQRVVEYQQALQTVSDPLLGWTTVGEHQYYVRQFRNMKGSVALDSVDGAALADYAAITGHLLAKGHARTSGASMIVGYAGSSSRLDAALARFARLYADQTEADYAALVKAADRGILPIERGL
ncbi:MAG: DUF2252 family protein [Actinobacteria bacterium]|nr:DUF2252 family protein [Actinomycetota bacterium]